MSKKQKTEYVAVGGQALMEGIMMSGPKGTETRIFHCDLGRKGNIRRFAKAALEFLESYIKITQN